MQICSNSYYSLDCVSLSAQSDLQPRKAGGVNHMMHGGKEEQMMYTLLTMACTAIMGHHGYKVSVANVGGVTAQYQNDTQCN